MPEKNKVQLDIHMALAMSHLKLAQENITKAKELAAEKEDHPCGHTWEIKIVSRGHSWGVTSEDPPVHSDSNYWDEHNPVIVRADNLQEALLLATTTPLADWFPEEKENEWKEIRGT